MSENVYEAELDRLWRSPAHVQAETDLMGGSTRLMDGPSFVSQYREIVVGEAYDFETDSPSPVIIDGGANIGVASLWWLARWPEARVIAYEPDAEIFSVLQHNLRNWKNVELHRAAITTERLGSIFVPEGTDAGRLASLDGSAGGDPATSVPSVRLRDVFDDVGPVDLLKLDIEGAETAVLHDAETRLHSVARIFVEYHSFAGQRQTLADLLGLLRRNGFRIYLASPPQAPRPFRGAPVDRGIDMQCNIWAWRTSAGLDTSSRR